MSISKQRIISIFTILLILLPSLAACQSGAPVTGDPTRRVAAEIGQVAAAQEVAAAFLAGWEVEDYAGMYGLLSSLSQDSLSQDGFAAEYMDLANTLTLQSLEAQVLSTIAEGRLCSGGFSRHLSYAAGRRSLP